MKKILVIGANGMAGHVVKTYLEEETTWDVRGLARTCESMGNCVALDVTDLQQLEFLLHSERFNIVVNCVGILNKDAENNIDKAVWLNSYFPHRLSQLGVINNFRLIHISTDCVFAGKSKGGYTEDAAKDGIGYYAQSKALGEVINGRDLTIRTSIIGPELKETGIGLFHWFMSQPESVHLKGFTRAYWTGVTTLVLARAIREAIEQNLTGLYHLVYAEKISKFDLITLFNRIFRGGDISIDPEENYKVDKSLINTRTDFDFVVPGYEDMLLEMKKWMEHHSEKYVAYYNCK
jgi:dTDP-4-dehydrorhamnose reductase